MTLSPLAIATDGLLGCKGKRTLAIATGGLICVPRQEIVNLLANRVRAMKQNKPLMKI